MSTFGRLVHCEGESMNSNELLNELNKFPLSSYNTILVDGPWGSGKTYLINEFIKENKNKYRIYYISLLGKKRVDEINTALFNEVNKGENKVYNLVPSAINPLLKEETTLDYILEINKKISKTIVILDDFERYASSDYNAILSYVTSLILKGSKVIVVSNLLELGNGELYDFNLLKEKLFDRVYKAELFNLDLINSKFKEYSKYLDSGLIKLFNSNYRIVNKTYTYFKEVISKLNDAKIKLKKEDIKALIFYITCLMNEFFGNKKLELKDFKVRAKDNEIDFNLNYFKDSSDGWSSVFIYHYALNNIYLYKYEYQYLFIATLLKAYLFLDFTDLIEFYKFLNNKEKVVLKKKNISLIDLNYLSISMQNYKNNLDFAGFLEKIVGNTNNFKEINSYYKINERYLNKEEKSLYKSLIDTHNQKEGNDVFLTIKSLYETSKIDQLFSFINNHVEYILSNINQEKNILKSINYLLNLDDENYLNLSEKYLLNYIEIINQTSLKNEVIEYLNSLKTNSSIKEKLIYKLRYIKEEIN